MDRGHVGWCERERWASVGRLYVYSNSVTTMHCSACILISIAAVSMMTQPTSVTHSHNATSMHTNRTLKPPFCAHTGWGRYKPTSFLWKPLSHTLSLFLASSWLKYIYALFCAFGWCFYSKWPTVHQRYTVVMPCMQRIGPLQTCVNILFKNVSLFNLKK